MLKLLGNLKQSLIYVVFIIFLLCVQATADLSLPDYTSNIVNVGIQQNGIEKKVPEVISKDTMDSILLFTENDEEILNYYDMNSGDLSDKEKNIIKKYFKEEPDQNSIYLKKDLSEKEEEDLESLIKMPLMTFASISNEEYEVQIKDKILENIPEEQK